MTDQPSILSNRSGANADATAQYINAVLALVGDQDPMTILHTTPNALESTVMGLTSEQCRQREAPEKWSAALLLQHLADSELVWGFRLRLILAEDRPSLTPYDQDEWVKRLGYKDTDPGDAMTLFGTLRRANLWLLGRATPEDFNRVGVHAERGEESLRHQVILYAGHDLVHRRQLERIRKAVASG